MRHIGLIHAVELVERREGKIPFDSSLRLGYRIYRNALSKGLLLRNIGDVLYFNPPLNITREDLKTAVEIMHEAVAEELSRL